MINAGLTMDEVNKQNAAKAAAEKAAQKAMLSKISQTARIAQYAWRVFDNIISVK